MVRTVAVDATHIYWNEPELGAIGRANLDGSGVDRSFISGIPHPAVGYNAWGVDVDGSHIYWSKLVDNAEWIGRANLDGSGVDDTFIPTNRADRIAVDASHIYWTTTGGIARANLDGTGVDQTFIADPDPGGVAVDAGNAPPPPPPKNTSLPVISGTARDGKTLTTTTGSWDSPAGLAYSYQWQRCDAASNGCTDISLAHSDHFALTSADVGDEITVVVNATDIDGQTTPAQAAPSAAVAKPPPPKASGLPSISLSGGSEPTLVARGPAWISPDPLTITWEWQRCDSAGDSCSDIDVPSSLVYVPVTADYGHMMTVVVHATDAEGQAASATTAPVGPIPAPIPVARQIPVITGTLQDGQILATTHGVWAKYPLPLSYSVQWQRCDPGGTLALTSLARPSTTTA